MNDGPRVFAEGTVTVVVSADGMTAYVGANQVRHVKSLAVLVNGDARQLEVTVQEGSGAGEAEIEERLLRSLGWAVVKRSPGQ